MTFNEFKAWLDGFAEGWGGGNAPSPEQWAKIREKLDSVVPPSLAPLSPYLNPPTRFDLPLQPYGPNTGTPMPALPNVTCGTASTAADPTVRMTN